MRSSFRTILLLYHILSIWDFLILTCTIYILAPAERFERAETENRESVGTARIWGMAAVVSLISCGKACDDVLYLEQ